MAEYRVWATPHPNWVDVIPYQPSSEHPQSTHDTRALPIQQQPGLDIEEFDIPARDEYPIRVRSYKRSNAINLPLLIYLHGGGFITGGLETDDESCRAIAADIPILVLNVEYRLAPEHQFPVGFEDSRDVVYWAASSAGQQQLSTDMNKGFILGGTTAGANFTAGIAHLAVQDKLPSKLTGLLFLTGSFCHPDARPEKYRDRILSVDEINDAPGLTRKSIDYFVKKYGAPPSDTRLSPLLFESHADIAIRVTFYICGWGPRRDEALLFDELLQDEGILTRKNVYKGLPHGFWATCPDLEESREWKRDLLEGVRFLLAQQ